MEFNHLVSVVISTHNRREKLIRLISSIMRSKYPQRRIEIIVVDDASTDGTFKVIRKLFPQIKMLRNNVELFPSACRNLGIRNSMGNYIFLIDDDNVLDENTINELIKVFTKHKNVGLAGPIAFYYTNSKKIFCAGGELNSPMFFPTHIGQGSSSGNFSARRLIECDYVPNAFMINKTVIDDVGLFDERFCIAWEEADFAVRIKKRGYKIVVSTTAKVFHDVPTTQDFHITKSRAYWRGRNRILFYRKYVPVRCIFIFIDIAGFIALLLKVNKSLRKCLFQYLKGIKDGLISEN